MSAAGRLVIVGGGTAGLSAAVTAGEMGLDALLVEKTDGLGGMLHWSSGHFSAAGTRRQRERGIDDDPDLHFEDVMAMGHGRSDPALVRLAVDTMPPTVDWLDDLGFPFGSETPAFVSGHERYQRPRTYWGGEDPTAGGTPIMETLLAHLDRDRVEIVFDSAVRGIVTEGEPGRLAVRGIEVEHNGATATIETPHVLLATGGYAASRVLVAELQPGYGDALTGCMEHATGDGHRMLMGLGVDLVACDTYLPTMGMIEDPDRPGWGLRLTEARLIVDPRQRPPWEVWVNTDGLRFVAEDTASPFARERALRAQPGLAMYAIWDSTVVGAASPPIGPDWTWEELSAVAQDGRWLHMADSVAALAHFLGVPSGPLERTLSDYGPEGEDPFGRDHRPVSIDRGPFFGVRVVGGMLLSRGGPGVDDGLRPLDRVGAPIGGLYAAGELLGMGQFSGDSFAGGMSVGPALAFGRLVVQRLATGVS